MHKKIINIYTLITFFIGISAIFCYWLVESEDRYIFVTGGHILTMDADNTEVSAMLIKNNKIHKVWQEPYDSEEIPDGASWIDLKGKTVLPGIIDAHGHFPGEGLSAVALDLNSPPIGRVKSIEDILQSLKAVAEKTKKGEWIRGYGYDDTEILEKRHITRKELDSISTEHPIFIFHISAHMAVVNSFALDMLGLNSTSLANEGGEYHLDENGELSGLLIETAQNEAKKLAFKFSPLESWDIVQKATNAYFKQGVTTAQNGLLEPDKYNIISWLGKLGLYDIRLVVWPSSETQKKIISGELSEKKQDEAWFKIGAVKLVSDGSIQGYTGYLSHPYHQHPDGKPDDYRGYPIQAKETLIQEVLYFHKNGYQLAIHSNGDAAIDNVIEAIELAQKEYPNNDSRTVMVHSQMVRADQLLKFKELGITPSYFNTHVYYWGERHKELFIGQNRAESISPMYSTQRLGIPFSLHSDSPVVPMRPWLSAWNAVSRETYQGDILGEKERIEPIAALRAITINAAWQQFVEDDRGSLEVGKLADFIIVEKNPLNNLESLKNPNVLSTWIDGVCVYEKAQ
jgi:predicted amidohydrolase YtcJ